MYKDKRQFYRRTNLWNGASTAFKHKSTFCHNSLWLKGTCDLEVTAARYISVIMWILFHWKATWRDGFSFHSLPIVAETTE